MNLKNFLNQMDLQKSQALLIVVFKLTEEKCSKCIAFGSKQNIKNNKQDILNSEYIFVSKKIK